ncbi:MAG: 4Fe-4S binding protein [Lachnospiraceae bacterium]|nr:4Fe-4S binding protein [Lachnospiraceae bacterium]
MSSCLTLKKSNCKNCYKCIRHCPVKSIRFSAGQAHIIDDACILCGHCFVVCPQNAKEVADDREQVRVLIGSGAPVIASLAPSFVANYEGAGIESVREALQALGFADAEETALGATLVKREYDRILSEGKRDVVISSCCPSVNLLIQKYFPRVLPSLADVLSPMQAHCAEIKRRRPDAKTVFIGPCVAKKDEAKNSGQLVDASLTFEDLSRWLEEEGITIRREQTANDHSRARFFPTTGGILKTMTKEAKDYAYLALDGVENCIAALRDIENGALHKCFIEMSACAGGCVGGPVMEKYRSMPVRNYLAVATYAGEHDFDIAQPEESAMRKHFDVLDLGEARPDEEQITQILHDMGKFAPLDELNCGSCGYDTCRAKAVAIFQGKAEISMCLPFLKEQAESFSNTIVDNTPNGILVVNDKLEVQQINQSALRIMNLQNASAVLGDQVVRILDPQPFRDVQKSGRGTRLDCVYLAEYNRHVEQTIVPVQDGRMLLCILRDVSEEVLARREKEEISRQTALVADKVVEKQMRIVQDIASLLGETAAETKIALSKLKESITDE